MYSIDDENLWSTCLKMIAELRKCDLRRRLFEAAQIRQYDIRGCWKAEVRTHFKTPYNFCEDIDIRVVVH
jgi:hypothetical protein